MVWIEIILILLNQLVFDSGASGLTFGLLSMDETNLSIFRVSGTPTEQAYAEKIEPIRKNTHLLLVSLLLSNTVLTKTLPILFDTIHLEGWQAILCSTIVIVNFGDIIPQAVCVRYGLQIGAFFGICILDHEISSGIEVTRLIVSKGIKGPAEPQ